MESSSSVHENLGWAAESMMGELLAQALGLASPSKRSGLPRTIVGHPLGAVLDKLQYQDWQLSTPSPRKPKVQAHS